MKTRTADMPGKPRTASQGNEGGRAPRATVLSAARQQAGMPRSPGSGGPVAALTAKKATGGQVTRPALVKVERSLASNTLTPPQAEQGEYVRSPPADSAP